MNKRREKKRKEQNSTEQNYTTHLASQESKSSESHVLSNFMTVEIALYPYINTLNPTISFSF
jgi:hypothetical protein